MYYWKETYNIVLYCQRKKIIYEANNGHVTSMVSHKGDLLGIFGKDIVDEINNDRAA